MPLWLAALLGLLLGFMLTGLWYLIFRIAGL